MGTRGSGVIDRIRKGAFAAFFLLVTIVYVLLAAPALAGGASAESPAFVAVGSGGETPSEGPPASQGQILVIATVAVLLLVLLGSLLFMYVMQRRFFVACLERDELKIYARSPAGLPEGTIRSMLAFLIVGVSLYFLGLVVFSEETRAKFPDLLSGILGSVLGFYFGTRTGGREPNEALADQVGELRAERDRAVEVKDQAVSAQQGALEEKHSQDAEGWRSKVQKGIVLTRTVAALLPKEMGQKYVDLADRLGKGLEVVDGLMGRSGTAAEAAAKGAELFTEFKTRNPVLEIVARALKSFGPMLATALPGVAPFALITAIVGAGIKLGGARYQIWKARILHLPFSPAVIPLQVVDANTGFGLIQQCPIFRKAFEAELLNNDRPFLKSLIDEFLREPDTDALWKKHRRRFESRSAFEEGLSELRRAAADAELEQDVALVAADLLKNAGGYRAVVGAVDRIHQDPEALANLDAVMLAAEGLHRNNEPVLDILKKVEAELESPKGGPPA